MKALVIGATGATGKELVSALLNDDKYNTVVVFVRRSTGVKDPKLTEYVVNFSDIAQYADLVNGDILFSCLGTTLKSAGSKKAQWQIDFDIPLTVATVAKSNGVHSFVLVSSSNANPCSLFFYPRMKGELEIKIAELQFAQYIVFRPGILDRPHSDRPAESVAVKLIKALNRIGVANKQCPLPTQILAEKLSKAPYLLPDGEIKVSLDEIIEFI